jgi:hypothetical protein
MADYLSGSKSPKINAMLAATGWNLKKLMKELKNSFCDFFRMLLFRKFQLLVLNPNYSS